MKKLAIIVSHPIQYYAPVFKLLHQRKRIDIMVFYTWGEVSVNKFDPGFNKTIQWDIPVLDGYPFKWAKNISKAPGTHHFKGIINPGIIEDVEDYEPDAILVYGWGYQGHLKVLRYFKNKVPVLFRGDSTLLDNAGGIKNTLKRLFLKRVYKNVDHALYVGTNSKAYFKQYGLKEPQLRFAPHAIDNMLFAADRTGEAKLLLDKILHIPDSDIIILFAGKFEEKKDPVILLQAFKALEAKNAHLLFAGNGPLEQQLKTLALNTGNVHFMDFQNQSQMPVLYQACDLFCLPSKGPNETWGLAINEAMAAGKAILASDKTGAAVDLVHPGKNGEIFKAANLPDLLSKLSTLLGPGKLSLSKMGQQSKEIIADWNFEFQVNVMEELVING